MAQEKTMFPMYKGKPLVRNGNTLYYGDMRDPFVIKLQIKSRHEANGMEIADKVAVQLLSTDPDISPRKAVIKTSEKENLYYAIDIGSVWLQKALKKKKKNKTQD